MAFCTNCGTRLIDGSHFCHSCGISTNNSSTVGYSQRDFVYEGKIIKCPNCGEPLASFQTRCPVCGHEFREAKVSSVVKEFALKLETLDAERVSIHESSNRKKVDVDEISEKEARKIELIRSFPVPNTKEDILEFMILATSCISYDMYDSYKSEAVSRGYKEVNTAWYSKVQQVYEKAKRSTFSDDTFQQIESLYTKCKNDIRSAKKKGIIKSILMFAWIPLLFVIFTSILAIGPHITETKEIKRLEAIVDKVQVALDDGEYMHALRLAESIEYEEYDDALETEWAVTRDYWIDKVIDTAAENGVILEYTTNEDDP